MKNPAEISQNTRKARLANKVGKAVINFEIPKSKRLPMVSDMEQGQVFKREGELCMRVLNVCDGNVKGKASGPEDLWVVSLSTAKVWLATNTPVEPVSIEINAI
jgi:hypothetical protein